MYSFKKKGGEGKKKLFSVDGIPYIYIYIYIYIYNYKDLTLNVWCLLEFHICDEY